MSKYRDTDEVLEQIRKKLGIKSLDYLLEAERQIVDAIQSAPSIDIVRCKCDFGKCHEQGDTLYESSDWDGGIGFDYIRDIKYCPLCGGLLDGEEQTEREGE